jgi:hypothetical protein
LKKSIHALNKKPEITVITSSRNPVDSDLHKRYLKFFGEIEYYPIGFENFAKNLKTYL